MLNERPMEQSTLFKEIMYKKLSVREAEAISRRIAVDKVRKKEKLFDPQIVEFEEKLAESFGTRVHIEKGEAGGKITIDFFSNEDLHSILELVKNAHKGPAKNPDEMLQKHIAAGGTPAIPRAFTETPTYSSLSIPDATTPGTPTPVDDRAPVEKEKEENEEIYSVKNFSL